MPVRPLAAGVDLLALAQAYPDRYPHSLDSAVIGQSPARGAYAGFCGYISWHGTMENILIRTLVVRDGEVRFRTGAGIVADSNPEAELQETRHRARGLLNALRR